MSKLNLSIIILLSPIVLISLLLISPFYILHKLAEKA